MEEKGWTGDHGVCEPHHPATLSFQLCTTHCLNSHHGPVTELPPSPPRLPVPRPYHPPWPSLPYSRSPPWLSPPKCCCRRMKIRLPHPSPPCRCSSICSSCRRCSPPHHYSLP